VQHLGEPLATELALGDGVRLARDAAKPRDERHLVQQPHNMERWRRRGLVTAGIMHRGLGLGLRARAFLPKQRELRLDRLPDERSSREAGL
jgi:hypothetical protein